ncbi:MAG: UDP-2,3-diacylglucosamine diphosphatase LpxI, partial [Planctomycetes bacterium]|nr:UDP-2,3-diacylglucosamine diphosphatase LpxI [Planctomycetota bacterium]
MPRKLPPVGLIAGSGRLPFLIARGVHNTGRPVIVAGLAGLASPRLPDQADKFAWFNIVRLGKLLRYLRRNGAYETVMIGGVHKREMFSPLRFLRYIPDLAAVRLWYSTVRNDRRDNAVLLAVTDELRKEGIELVSSVKYCQEHLACDGLMTKTPVPRSAEADVDFGWNIARASADLDIGQSIAVKDRDIIAVEAIEGTDAMIRRTGRLCRNGGWTMVKVARPKQDMRFDVPTVGPTTIRNLKDARCICLVLQAKRTLIADKPAT